MLSHRPSPEKNETIVCVSENFYATVVWKTGGIRQEKREKYFKTVIIFMPPSIVQAAIMRKTAHLNCKLLILMQCNNY